MFVVFSLQQCLPLAVLKPRPVPENPEEKVNEVATVPTACGIETRILCIR